LRLGTGCDAGRVSSWPPRRYIPVASQRLGYAVLPSSKFHTSHEKETILPESERRSRAPKGNICRGALQHQGVVLDAITSGMSRSVGGGGVVVVSETVSDKRSGRNTNHEACGARRRAKSREGCLYFGFTQILVHKRSAPWQLIMRGDLKCLGPCRVFRYMYPSNSQGRR
jgi:hypothetical protein